jgi:hypothetical protein
MLSCLTLHQRRIYFGIKELCNQHKPPKYEYLINNIYSLWLADIVIIALAVRVNHHVFFRTLLKNPSHIQKVLPKGAQA